MCKEEIRHFRDKFAKNLKRIRKEKGLNQEELSELIEVQREHIAKVETGRRNLSFEKIILLSIKLDISLKELFDFD